MKIDEKDPTQVSVLCLAYNHEKYIRETLEGFVNQKTNFKFEVLIHDDASIDSTPSIIAEYASKYPDLIKPIYQTENQYSRGVKIQTTYNYPRAKGKYLAWCEGDDYWCDDYKLQRQYDVMERHQECSMCVHKVQCINEDGSINSRVIPEKYYGFAEDGVLFDYKVADALWGEKGGYPFHTCSYFVKREAIRDMIEGTLEFERYLNKDQVIIRTALSDGCIFYFNQVMSFRRLFSIGNYNSRLKNLTERDIRVISLKEAKGDLLFDLYASGRFHKWIIRSVSDRVVRCGAYDQSLMDEFIKDMNLTKEDMLSNCSIQNKMKYYLSSHLHPVYVFLRKIVDFTKKKK